ncbi:hypothetical protein [Prevotella disiens]|uniref:hypothetical protein n=1 Tax=Prevotella disiens TaxID=28130 RepID=UPI00336AD291
MGFSATRKGIKLFNPLAMLLYSATHREVLNMVKLLNGMVLYGKHPILAAFHTNK